MGRENPNKHQFKISPCQECIVRSMCETVCEILWDYIEPHFTGYYLQRDDWRSVLHFLRSSLKSSRKFEHGKDERKNKTDTIRKIGPS